MNNLTTIAALPRMGAGFASAPQPERARESKVAGTVDLDAAAEFAESLGMRLLKGEISRDEAYVLVEKWTINQIAAQVIADVMAAQPGQDLIASWTVPKPQGTVVIDMPGFSWPGDYMGYPPPDGWSDSEVVE